MWKILIGAAAGFVAGRASQGKDSEHIKPLARAALTTGIKVLEKGYEAAAHLRETLEDVVAEARAEMEARAAAEQKEQEREAEAEEPAPKRARRNSNGPRKSQPKTRHARASHD